MRDAAEKTACSGAPASDVRTPRGIDVGETDAMGGVIGSRSPLLSGGSPCDKQITDVARTIPTLRMVSLRCLVDAPTRSATVNGEPWDSNKAKESPDRGGLKAILTANERAATATAETILDAQQGKDGTAR